MSNITPKKLAFFYSYPSLINNSNGDLQSVVAVFNQYKYVVFGSGLEESTHPDHANTISIITDPGMKNVVVFGYISSTLPVYKFQEKIDLWSNMGVKGIFCDEFGYDYGLTREKQKEIIWSVHNKGKNGLIAFVNAWNPDDVFADTVDPIHNANGLPSNISNTDFYLAESFAVINGAFDDADSDNNGIKDFQDKAVKMNNYKVTFGTNMAAVATSGSVPFAQNLADYSYFAAVLNGFDAWAWGEQYYSAVSAQLPMRKRSNISGTKFTSPITNVNGIIEHQTNVGIHLDTTSHTVSILLD